MLLSCRKLSNRPIQMLKVTKFGLNNTPEDFHVNRFKVQNALYFNKKSDTCHQKDTGPAPDHIDPDDVEGDTHSNILLPHQRVDHSQRLLSVISLTIMQTLLLSTNTISLH